MKNEPTFKIFRNTCPLPNSNPSCQKDCITNQGPSCPLPFSIILSVTIQQQALIACVKKMLILESCESPAYSANIHSLSSSSVGEVYSSAPMNFVCHITCLVQWDVNRCDRNTGLRLAPSLSWPPTLLGQLWEEHALGRYHCFSLSPQKKIHIEQTGTQLPAWI